MIIVTVLFAAMGLALLAMGRWGSRGYLRLGVVPGYDERNIRRRQATLRRGAYTCYVAGALFLLIAGASLLVRPDPARCVPVPGTCTAACVVAGQCRPEPVPAPAPR